MEASLTIRIRIVNPTSLSIATMVKMMISVKEGFHLDESECEETRQQWERVREVGRQTGDQGDRTLGMETSG